MEAAGHAHHHHEMPTSGTALTNVAISATLHCLTGCAIGEIAGMAIGTALGFSNWGTVALAVALAFLFGYMLTSLPLLRAGLSLSAVVPIALASDTLSIATMEIVDNAVMLIVPGAMHAGLDEVLFWGSLAFALAIAGVFAVPVNRYLIARGKGHAVVHETGIHGGPSPRLVGIVAAFAFVFGSTVLVAEAFDDEGGGGGHSGEHSAQSAPAAPAAPHGDAHGGGHEAPSADAALPGLSDAANGLTLRLETSSLPPGERAGLHFRIVGAGGKAVRDFEVEHAKRLHLIVVRRDTRGFQHLHPRMARDGEWRTAITLPDPGDYRVFADFKRAGRKTTLASDLDVPGSWEPQPLPEPATTAKTDGYDVRLSGARSPAGEPAQLAFEVTRGGEPVAVQDYLGAKGHLVALREGDLAYLHTHPEHADDGPVRFETEFPTAAGYRLFFQFRHANRVHTAEYTRDVTPAG